MNIPRISIGTAGFANMYENITLDECSKIVNKAIIHKYSYFDTAPYYGHGPVSYTNLTLPTKRIV